MDTTLIERIKEYQQEQGLSDGRFALLLGIDRSTWSYIKAGKRNPGSKFFRAVAREIPALRRDVARYMKS